ncbi:MAG TPA: hypothetical protein VJS37_16530 [Terriglobales bacterium]|nr:hypothetical protein [Terriglobales bacterium]
MPSLNDFFNQVQQVNSNLQQLDTDLKSNLQQVDTDVKQVDTDVKAGFQNTITVLNHIVQLQTYADHALFHITQQNDTIICILEHISRNTCTLVNEAHKQTQLQTSIERSAGTLLELYKFTHPDAALQLERIEALQKQLLECCPPPREEPPCTYAPCPAPKPIQDLRDQGPAQPPK